MSDIDAGPAATLSRADSTSATQVYLTAATLDRLVRVAKFREVYRDSFIEPSEYAPQQRAMLLLQAFAEIGRCQMLGLWNRIAGDADRVSTSEPMTELFSAFLARTEGDRRLDATERELFESGFESHGVAWITAQGLAEQVRLVRSEVFGDRKR